MLHRRVSVSSLALAGLLLAAGAIASGCGGSGSGGGASFAGSTAPAATTSPSTSTSTSTGTTGTGTAGSALAAPAVVPLILVHGTDSRPEDWGTYLDRLAPGRAVVPALYAAEADALAPGSLTPNVVVAFGYYRETASGPMTDASSIGACPVARTDGLDAAYPHSFADRLRRGVDGIRRATGAPQVDLVLHSMGGLVGRAYTRWLSLDASGRSAVRRIFLIASPSRGVNALEAEATAFSYTGPLAYRRQGECLELCAEAKLWGGRAYVDWLDEDWDGFCASHSIPYAGMSLLGVHGPAAGLNPTAPGGIPPTTNALPGGGYVTGLSWAIQSFLQAIWTFTPADLNQLPLLSSVLGSMVSETSQALEPGDGIVRFSSSRLDQAPFGRPAFFGQYEGVHANLPDPERGYASSYALECVRTFCLASHAPGYAQLVSRSLTPVRAPGRATWLAASVELTGDAALAAQLVEETFDANGKPVWAIGYGSPLRPGKQTIGFQVVPGGGTRRYRLVVYGPSGILDVLDGVDVTLDDGPLESPPLANVALAGVTPAAGSSRVSLALSSNAAPGDATEAFKIRLDHGAWTDWSTGHVLALPALAPGIHRIEALARSSSNGAGVLVEQGTPTGLALVVDGSGNATLLP